MPVMISWRLTDRQVDSDFNHPRIWHLFWIGLEMMEMTLYRKLMCKKINGAYDAACEGYHAFGVAEIFRSCHVLPWTGHTLKGHLYIEEQALLRQITSVESVLYPSNIPKSTIQPFNKNNSSYFPKKHLSGSRPGSIVHGEWTADLMIFSRWCTSHLRLMRLMCSSAMTCDHVPRHLGVMAGCLRRQRLQATNGYKVIKIAMSCMNQHRYKPWTSDDPCFWVEKSHSFNNKETIAPWRSQPFFWPLHSQSLASTDRNSCYLWPCKRTETTGTVTYIQIKHKCWMLDGRLCILKEMQGYYRSIK